MTRGESRERGGERGRGSDAAYRSVGTIDGPEGD